MKACLVCLALLLLVGCATPTGPETIAVTCTLRNESGLLVDRCVAR